MKYIDPISPLDKELIEQKLCLWCHEPTNISTAPYCSTKCKELKRKKYNES